MDSQLAEQLTTIFPDKVIPESIQQFYMKIEEHHILDDISAYSALYQDKEKLKKLLNLNGFSCNWPTKTLSRIDHKHGGEASFVQVNASAINSVENKPSKTLTDTPAWDDDFDLDDFLESEEFSTSMQQNADLSDFRFNKEMIRDYQQDNQDVLKEAIVENNQRLVWKIVQRYKRHNTSISLTEEDLMISGNIGLLKAIERFDPDMGFEFSTYASNWIRQSIARDIMDYGYMIRLPVHLGERLNKLKRVESEFQIKYPNYSIEEICAVLEMSKEEYLKLKTYEYQYRNMASTDKAVGEDGDTALLDLLQNRHAVLSDDSDNELLRAPEELAINKAVAASINNLLVDTLTETECSVVKMRLGLDGEEENTLEKIGGKFGLTRERIRQIESKALKKIRKKMNYLIATKGDYL
ncbi:sigma-70 family RNA polymerase sigma factor [Trichococcus alkaliphilus]|uniref:sigma-70 family RNA polymerase sigma factor n=1 Tax=Trichococcus alkaliphilus TaxID=2052943 RepID=UPI001374F62E|nr:RNA polymerase sigma factor RpoD/SigA [Trichococcus alkaliphilus]